jgi:hypothetical protein
VELLALKHTIKEGFALERLFRDIQLELHNRFKFYCDNMQTICLVVKDNACLHTRLRHVDIQICSSSRNTKTPGSKISYLPTADIPVDELTKVLPKQKFNAFIKQLGLIDIKDLLENVAEEDSGIGFDSIYESDFLDE